MDKFTTLTLPNSRNFLFGAKCFVRSGMGTMDSYGSQGPLWFQVVHGSWFLGQSKRQWLFSRRWWIFMGVEWSWFRVVYNIKYCKVFAMQRWNKLNFLLEELEHCYSREWPTICTDIDNGVATCCWWILFHVVVWLLNFIHCLSLIGSIPHGFFVVGI